MKYSYGDLIGAAMDYALVSDSDEDLSKAICVAVKMTTAQAGCNAETCPFFHQCDYPQGETGSLKWVKSEVACK